MLRKFANLTLVAALLCISSPGAFAGDDNSKDRTLAVMTRNMDAGSDFLYVLQAASDPTTTPVQLLMAITNTFREMHASNFPGRADDIAAEIEAGHPDLVALQEVTTLRTGPYGGHATTVVDDALQSLRAALDQRGLHYVVVKAQTNADIELPAFDDAFNPITVGLTDLDVVLARSDLPVSELKVETIQAQYFNAILNFPVAGQSIPFLRGWIAIDVQLRGKQYRFVTTHLETFSPDYQAAQTNELLNGPLNTDVPVILAGDLNSDAHLPAWETGPAYGILLGSGFRDIWNELNPADPGLTWPLHAEDPDGPSLPTQRIDLVLTRGTGIDASAAALTGTAMVNGLWPSDHAGVIASLKLLP